MTLVASGSRRESDSEPERLISYAPPSFRFVGMPPILLPIVSATMAFDSLPIMSHLSSGMNS
jgi:hypothetical protein